jgi:hypothetical protein
MGWLSDFSCKILGRACTCDERPARLAFDLDTSQRAIMLGIQQMAELGQLLVDRALEQVSPSPAF